MAVAFIPKNCQEHYENKLRKKIFKKINHPMSYKHCGCSLCKFNSLYFDFARYENWWEKLYEAVNFSVENALELFRRFGYNEIKNEIKDVEKAHNILGNGEVKLALSVVHDYLSQT